MARRTSLSIGRPVDGRNDLNKRPHPPDELASPEALVAAATKLGALSSD